MTPINTTRDLVPVTPVMRTAGTIAYLRRKACLLDARLRTMTDEPEKGLATAEYAVVMIAATGFAGLLVAILKSGAVKTLLTNIVRQALSV